MKNNQIQLISDRLGYADVESLQNQIKKIDKTLKSMNRTTVSFKNISKKLKHEFRYNRLVALKASLFVSIYIIKNTLQ